MSRTRCNFCLLEGVRALGRTTGQHVTIVSAPVLGVFPDAWDVYLHPPTYAPPPPRTVASEDAVDKEVPEYWIAWLASLPQSCVCYDYIRITPHREV